MSASSDAMTAACTAAEAGAVQLANAFVAYQTAFRVAAQAVHDATPGPRGLQDGADLEHAIGPERLASFLYQRLIALGAERVVGQPGALAPADATRNNSWLSRLSSHLALSCV